MSEITELEYATCKLEMLLAAIIEASICLKYYHPVVPFEEVAYDWNIPVETLKDYLSGTYPFTLKELSRSVLQGLVITTGLLILMYYLIQSGSSEIHTRTMVFTTLVIANILLTLTGRSNQETILKTIRYKNNLVPIIIGITLLLLTIALFFPPAMKIFEFESISIANFLTCTLVAVLSVVWIEFYKAIAYRFGN